jgi:hypothetical protein
MAQLVSTVRLPLKVGSSIPAPRRRGKDGDGALLFFYFLSGASVIVLTVSLTSCSFLR